MPRPRLQSKGVTPMGAAKDEEKRLAPGNAARTWGHAAQPVRRDLRGASSSTPGLSSMPSAEQAEARFKGDEDGFVYSRYANPTVAMFEERMCALEGADAARATSSGMAAVSSVAALPSQGRRPCGLGTSAVRHLPLRRRGSAAALRHRSRRWSTAATSTRGRKRSGRTRRVFFFETPTNPDARTRRYRRRVEIAHNAGALVVVDNVFATPLLQRPLAARRRHRGLFGDQAYRRPGALPRRRRARQQGVHRGEAAQLSTSTPAPRSARSTPGCC